MNNPDPVVIETNRFHQAQVDHERKLEEREQEIVNEVQRLTWTRDGMEENIKDHLNEDKLGDAILLLRKSRTNNIFIQRFFKRLDELTEQSVREFYERTS